MAAGNVTCQTHCSPSPTDYIPLPTFVGIANKDKLWQMKYDNKPLNGIFKPNAFPTQAERGKKSAFAAAKILSFHFWPSTFGHLLLLLACDPRAIRTKPIFQFPTEQSLVVCLPHCSAFVHLGFLHPMVLAKFPGVVIGANKSPGRTNSHPSRNTYWFLSCVRL